MGSTCIRIFPIAGFLLLGSLLTGCGHPSFPRYIDHPEKVLTSLDISIAPSASPAPGSLSFEPVAILADEDHGGYIVVRARRPVSGAKEDFRYVMRRVGDTSWISGLDTALSLSTCGGIPIGPVAMPTIGRDNPAKRGFHLAPPSFAPGVFAIPPIVIVDPSTGTEELIQLIAFDGPSLTGFDQLQITLRWSKLDFWKGREVEPGLAEVNSLPDDTRILPVHR